MHARNSPGLKNYGFLYFKKLNCYGHENIHSRSVTLLEEAVNPTFFNYLIFHGHEKYMNFHGHEKSGKAQNSDSLSSMIINMSGQNRQNTYNKGEDKHGLSE
jgi:hypothetical protein